ncbi:NUDIX hydrolase [Fadolivirus algeromassiliense]|uniref:NUDIX hydrolase n=1 Tax=Fadolivirus FV1/VV64 TaxID=3070911 RepID=A0A7D3UW08_9VIRU|nr:NUDIX hydrolase [Fadolivirus algeromassiliense]QKF94509.1 NUDIX hydrolase [Fadolivirus FV1/VV64]
MNNQSYKIANKSQKPSQTYYPICLKRDFYNSENNPVLISRILPEIKLDYPKNALVSSCLYYGTSHAIQDIYKQHPDHWIVCIGYYSTKTGTKTLVDFQLGVTGTPQHGESDETGAIRELEEEVGYTIKKGVLKQIPEKIDFRKRTCIVFSADAKDCHCLENEHNDILLQNESNDNVDRKLIILIHGELETMKTLITNAKPSLESEKIGYYSIIKCSEATELANIVAEKHKQISVTYS